MTRGNPYLASRRLAPTSRLARAIIPALLAMTLLAACRSGSATPTASAPTTTPAAMTTADLGSPTTPATSVAAATPTRARPGTPTPATPVAVTKTDVVVIQPFAASGLAPGFNRAGSVVGLCDGPSEVTPARADAWRCITNNTSQRFDPCFSFGDDRESELFCFLEPWQTNVALMVLRAPLPDGRPSGLDPTRPFPWGLELADGSRCQVEYDTTTLIAGQRVNAVCTNGSNVLGEIDRSQPTWSVLVARDAASQPQRIQIVRVWY